MPYALLLTVACLSPDIRDTQSDGLVGVEVPSPLTPVGESPLVDACHDGVWGEGEVDVDCGGACAPCAVGAICWSDADCVDRCDTLRGVCTDAPACDDGAWNGDESDVDCGGGCAPCPDGGSCRFDEDCAHEACIEGACGADPAATCRDGARNQGEADVDCGGDRCAPCSIGATCETWSDCASGACDGTCAPSGTPTCTDGALGPDEADVDCGGPCPACPIGASCDTSADCGSGHCDGTCLPERAASCVNERQDPAELGVDCGGPCAACPVALTDGDRDEGFETGDLSAFPWTSTGPVVVAADCAEGAWCAGGTGELRLPLRVREDGEVVLLVRVDPGGSASVRWGGARVWTSGATDGFVPVRVPVAPTPADAPPDELALLLDRATVDRISLPRFDLPIPAPTLTAPAWAARVPSAPWLIAAAVDPDGDAPIWEFEWDVDPTFPNPTRATGDGPVQGPPGGPWFWRARAHTAVDATPTAWSPVGAWDVGAEGAGWRATLLAAGVSSGLQWETDRWNNAVTRASAAVGPVPLASWGAATRLALDLPGLPADQPGDLRLTVGGDLDGPEEWLSVFVDGAWVTDLAPGTCATQDHDLAILASATTVVELVPTAWVNEGCVGASTAAARLDVTVRAAGTWETPVDPALVAAPSRVRLLGAGAAEAWLADAAGAPLTAPVQGEGSFPAVPGATTLVVSLAPEATLTEVTLTPW